MNRTVDEHRAAPNAALESVAREQILSRLREAIRVTEEDFTGQTDRVQELLHDAQDRAGAFSLVRQLDGDDQSARPFSFLTCEVLSSSGGGEPVTEFLLIPFGDVQVERPSSGTSFVFTREHAESSKRWFDTIGRKLAIDYEHQSFDRFNTRSDGLRPAAGWIGGLEVRDDGLWAIEVAWTERAVELLRGGEYRYFSPVIFWTDEDRSDVAALGPVALTNDPAMRGVSPLAASRRVDEGGDQDEPEDAERELVARADLDAAEAEVTLLKSELAAQEADTFVQRGMRLGKIVDSTSMDWRADYVRDRTATEERLARAPVVLPPGRVVTLNGRGDVQPLSGIEREFRRHSDVYSRWGIGPEDLAAYERALADGRIVQGGAA